MDLRDAMELRKTWFFETQLRHLNYEAFRATSLSPTSATLRLISEPLAPLGYPGGQLGGRLRDPGPVYLDDQLAVWTAEERTRRDAFAASLIGRMGDWLDFVNPTRLKEALGDLKSEYELSSFTSTRDITGTLAQFPRSKPSFGQGSDPAAADEGVGAAISRAELAGAKPWLIPELYNTTSDDTQAIATWVANLEQFVGEYERELQLVVGGTADVALPFDPDSTGAYRALIAFMLDARASRSASDAIRVRILNLAKKKPTDDDAAYSYEPALATSGSPMAPVTAFTLSDRTRYWTGVFSNPLKECVVLKANADMGLCQLVRLLYRYGTLPEGLGADPDITWRTRTPPGDAFSEFLATVNEDPGLIGDPALAERSRAAQTKLRVILEETSSRPRSAAPTFSVVAEEILKQGLKSFKFWIDEPLRAKDNDTLNKVKADVGVGDKDTEMEFWSENHYIMFASSEYLLGQLWESEEFQPGKVFLAANDQTGVTTGAARRDRGRARVLKWLNNRLLFGWMEFHSSGYYREHLWALLNLVDFSLDEEVRVKATMAVDLLLFDVVRYLHKGTMGAPGGRSQFKSKNCGWDNDLGDVVEIMLGVRGIFNEGSSQIGCSFATSSYVVPAVLLEIGASPPPYPFTDRSRVSITFDESPKYGISWSLDSDAKDSVLQGYAPKLATYSAFLGDVNREIERTHNGYTATDDDTVFFWGMSAFYNKQVVRNTFATVDKFDLGESPAFKGFVKTLIETILPLVRRAEGGLIGGLVGGLVGAAVGLLASNVTADDLEGDAADDLSLFIEGSTRTRANIVSYRTPDVMLSSIQDFRTGQLNFQSSVHQATLNTSVNVFTTAGFAGLDISDLAGAIGGAVIGSAIGLPVVGAVAGIAATEASRGSNPLGDDEDGPGWWTGYWALPMIAQHESAAIIVYDFHDAQTFLADAGSHTWFPKAGFDQVAERRTSAYDDANFALLDTGDIGPKGFWLFGKVVHPLPVGSPDEPGEGYVGVFSNQRPEWLTQDSAPYDSRLAEKSDDAVDAAGDAVDDKLDDLEDQDDVGYTGRQVIEIVVKRMVDDHDGGGIDHDTWLADVKRSLDVVTGDIIAKHRDDAKALADLSIQHAILQRIWQRQFPDYFADKDWYVDGKNVWIVQVGSKAEFGSFEAFMDQVSAARVHLDDSGDMECTYDAPRGDGSSNRLHLAYGDGGEFGLNGGDLATDLYPRFENPFVRGGSVQWGQREYCLDWNGKTLLHDYSDGFHPVRVESPQDDPHAAQTVKALAIFLRTGDEDMDAFTVATATVDVGCAELTVDQVVAAGPVGEQTTHDCEWIFLDQPVRRSPDMTLTLNHPPSTQGDDTPEWSASFTLKALMADRTLRDCALSFSTSHFEGSRRSTGPMPFVATLSQWNDWSEVADTPPPITWLLAQHPPYDQAWQDHHDLLVLDTADQLWHRRLACGGTAGTWERVDGAGVEPTWSEPFSWSAVSDLSGRTELFAVSGGRLLGRVTEVDGRWVNGWVDLAPVTPGVLAPAPVPLGTASTVTAIPSRGVVLGGVDLVVTGADGNVYTARGWQPDNASRWLLVDTADALALAPGVPVALAHDTLAALDSDGVLWVRPLDGLTLFVGGWQPLASPGFPIAGFAVGGEGGPVHIAVRSAAGEICVAVLATDGPTRWSATCSPDGWAPAPSADLAWTSPSPGQWWLFARGVDGSVRGLTRADLDGSPATWQPTGSAESADPVRPSTTLAATSRAKGQLELFAPSATGALSWTWWS